MDRGHALRAARVAAADHAWQEAFDGFCAVAAEELSPEEIEALSDVAFWAGHVSEAIEARQRAFAALEGQAALAPPRRSTPQGAGTRTIGRGRPLAPRAGVRAK